MFFKEAMDSKTNIIDPPAIEAKVKLALLERILKSYGSLIVAYSGGVDSTFLATVAWQVLQDQSLAVTAQSESLAPQEEDEASMIAKQFGFSHLVVRTDELQNESYAYATLWEGLAQNQKRVLIGISKESRGIKPYSAAFLRKYALSSPSSVDRAIEALLERDIIDRDNGSFLISDCFFKLWLGRLGADMAT